MRSAPRSDKVKCVISSASVFAFVYAMWLACGRDASTLFSGYYVPLMVFNVWIVVVTSAQHHDEDTRVFGQDEWTFTRGALQTVDRKYGLVGDALSKVRRRGAAAAAEIGFRALTRMCVPCCSM